jgi:hypothetical protein
MHGWTGIESLVVKNHNALQLIRQDFITRRK